MSDALYSTKTFYMIKNTKDNYEVFCKGIAGQHDLLCGAYRHYGQAMCMVGWFTNYGEM